jgi:NRPS condensation-like uncharacterized protein
VSGHKGDKTSRLSWVPAPTTPSIDWDSIEKPLNYPNGVAIDLRTEPGIRVWGREGKGSCDLWFQFHHACCDGLSAVFFLLRLGENYDHLVHNRKLPSVSTATNIGLLQKRDKYHQSLFRNILIMPYFLKRVITALVRPAPPIALPRRSHQGARLAKHIPVFASLTIGETETQLISQKAHQQDVSVNDLLVRDLLLALNDWNQKNDEASVRNIGIAIPVDMRPLLDGDALGPFYAASMHFINRSPKKLRNPDSLLRSVHKELKRQRLWEQGLFFIWTLKLYGLFKNGIKHAIQSRGALASAALSNMGIIPLPAQQGDDYLYRSGDVAVKSIIGIPPIQHGMHACFQVATYGGKMHLSVQVDPHSFDNDDAQELLGLFVSHIKKGLNE